MSAKILDGKIIAKEIKLDLKAKIDQTVKKPGLAAILIGDNQPSEVYINLKEQACKEVGINFHKYLYGTEDYHDNSEKEIIEVIKFLNKDKDIDGILIQLPLPKKFNTKKILKAISPEKDVDGFIRQDNKITPPTIAAVLELLKATNENLSDKKTLLLTNSDIFTKNLAKHLKKLGLKNISNKNKIPPKGMGSYDVIISALGLPQVIKKTMIKKGAIIIDVGINRKDNKIVGDVDPAVKKIANYISPVPGGVGPLTVACLLRNTYNLSKK